jgi:hypothetical protein
MEESTECHKLRVSLQFVVPSADSMTEDGAIVVGWLVS